MVDCAVTPDGVGVVVVVLAPADGITEVNEGVLVPFGKTNTIVNSLTLLGLFGLSTGR